MTQRSVVRSAVIPQKFPKFRKFTAPHQVS
jgi:hypothetical protein